MKTFRFPFILSIFLLLIVITSTAFLYKNLRTDSSTKKVWKYNNIPDALTHWRKQIRMVGGERAYADLKTSVSQEPQATQHRLAHAFGNELYQADGVEGITVCDQTMGFGCYHGFFAAALTHNGLESVTQLNDACTKKHSSMVLSCQHGIGHGIIEYYGYRKDRLAHSLDTCYSFEKQGRLLGCAAGVFMEYNFPLDNSSPEGQTIRPIPTDSPYDPCPSLPVTHQYTCYFFLGEWWRYASPDLSPEALSSRCTTLITTETQEACLLGVGYTVGVASGWQPAQAITYCNTIPSDRSRLLCRGGAAWSLYSIPRLREQATEVCEIDDIAEKASCLDYMNLLEK